MANTYTIFISHSWDNDKHHKDLKKLLNDRGYFNVAFEEATKETPINSTNATYVKQALKKRIENSNIVYDEFLKLYKPIELRWVFFIFTL